MKKNYHIIIGGIILIVAIILIVIFTGGKETGPIQGTVASFDQQESSETALCYLSKEESSGVQDIAWMVIDLQPGQVRGLFHNYPAMTDSLNVTFQEFKEVALVDNMTELLLGAFVYAEGMSTREDVLVRFNPSRAQFGFGVKNLNEATNRYEFADRSNITWKELEAENCSFVYDRIAVQAFLTDMIDEISPVDAVLGGTWYVTSINLDPENNTGQVSFEDGHILEQVSFSYSRSGNTVEINWE